MDYKVEVNDEIKSICRDLLEKYKDAIDNTGHTASGNLARTATYRCEFDGRYFSLIFELEEYWKYLEYGTKPHFPPISDIERWVTVKRLVPRTNTGKVPSTKQLAYVIARKISIEGTKPTRLLKNTMKQNKDLVSALYEAILNLIHKQVQSDIKTISM